MVRITSRHPPTIRSMSSRRPGGLGPLPPRQTASLFSIFYPQNIHNTGFTRSHKSLPLNILLHSRQDILSKADTRKIFRTKHLSCSLGYRRRWFSKIAARRPKAVPRHGNTADRHSRHRRLTPALHCILWAGAELGRKRIPQNEGNHNSQKHTLRRAPERWVPHSFAVFE